MRIGLLGFGTVGKGVYDLAAQRDDMCIVRVLCRRELSLPDADVTHDFQDILCDESIDTVVEVIGGLHPAWEYVKACIEAGKNVVTANKAMVATFYDELTALLARTGVRFRCTAAVGGGIGWLTELEHARRCERITGISGIMNGTCNYILDRMTRSGLTYAEALQQAQALGYAEADPTTDVDGIDTWHKLIVSANIAFGASLDKKSVPVCGIRSIGAEDVRTFTEHGLVCRLLATAKQDGGALRAYVHPTLVPNGSPEAAVSENYNLITRIGSVSGRQSLLGQGAGRYPTAYNVVQDLADVRAGAHFYTSCAVPMTAENSECLTWYVRGGWDGQCRERWDSGVITAPVSVSQMHAWKLQHPDAFIAALGV